MSKKESSINKVLAAGLTAATVLTSCGSGDTDAQRLEKWANSPGTKGFINLDAVKKAFSENQNVHDFQNRVNEIYEGDQLILLSHVPSDKGFRIEAYEDLNYNNLIDSNGDDRVFILQVSEQKVTLQGSGVNQYYKKSWFYNVEKYKEEEQRTTTRRHSHSTYFTHWYYGGRNYRRYTTPRSEAEEIRRNRDSYRKSNEFKTQVSDNVKFENRMKKAHGTTFVASVNNVSSVRTKHVTDQIRKPSIDKNLSNASKSSGWGIRNQSSSLKTSSFTQSSSPIKSYSSSWTSAKSSYSSSRSFGGGFRGSSGFKA